MNKYSYTEGKFVIYIEVEPTTPTPHEPKYDDAYDVTLLANVKGGLRKFEITVDAKGDAMSRTTGKNSDLFHVSRDAIRNLVKKESRNKRAAALQTKIAHLEYRLGKPTASKVKKVAVKTLTAGKFELGRVVQTRGVNHKSRENPQFKRDVDNAFRKYMRGDWGISKDKRMNNQAVKNGDDRIMGVYPTSEGDIWIITEWDRSVTTMLFPSEY